MKWTKVPFCGLTCCDRWWVLWSPAVLIMQQSKGGWDEKGRTYIFMGFWREKSWLGRKYDQLAVFPTLYRVTCEDLEQTGTVCTKYLQPNLKIFKNISQTITEQENLIPTDLSTIIPDSACFHLAQSIICHQVYPYCGVTPGIPRPRLVCAKSCQEFVTGRCSRYLNSGQHPQLVAKLRYGCDESSREAGDPPECIPLSLQASKSGKSKGEKN